MKIKLYTDIYPNTPPEQLVFSQFPAQKTEGAKRIEVSAEIPDYFFTGKIDARIASDKVKEIKDD